MAPVQAEELGSRASLKRLSCFEQIMEEDEAELDASPSNQLGDYENNNNMIRASL